MDNGRPQNGQSFFYEPSGVSMLDNKKSPYRAENNPQTLFLRRVINESTEIVL
jgi:hypothetical protein